ncbi:hypothetical protein NKR23_g2827 [Pleurostoma richardsiae]|uniref:Uncharacterized protein n=1 Tax=Pleurostoma richardsiae TaxID=41990 RepID=A0AA38RPN8_9PEZI|nr:hypothetical protein NKR23_g2827 [Pleurostoma richardsiae]
MTFRDAWSRLLRKSASSSSTASSGAPTDVTGTTSATTDHDRDSLKTDLSKQPSRLVSWLGGAPPKKKKKRKKQRRQQQQQQQQEEEEEEEEGALHPSERPLTRTNLRHQEMLSTFQFRFGSSGGRRSNSGISPRGSRHPSAENAVVDGHRHGLGVGDERMNSPLSRVAVGEVGGV